MNFENNLKNPESKLESTDFDYKIKNESNEEYLDRFLKYLKDDSLIEEENVSEKISLKKKKNEFTLLNDENNKAKSEKVMSLILEKELASQGEEKLDIIKNEENYLRLKEEITSSSRDSSFSDEQFDSQKYYGKTNQERDFFPNNFRKDGTPYSISLFGVGLQNSEDVEKYLKLKLDNKDICLLGGGHSCQDLVESSSVKPKSITNIDPFIAQENIERSPDGRYKSFNLRADDPKLEESLAEKNIDKFDEIWASYSVPFYNKNPEEIKNLFSNIRGLIADNGSCRITPLSTQTGCEEALLSEIEKIKDSKEFNIHLMDNTLILRKIKKEANVENQDIDALKEEQKRKDKEELSGIRESLRNL